ncbi:MAG: NRDE family protein [Porticoccaceae bacterium]|nr:NRDE family protein [Porticoccaceae bacterium]MEA3299301.1 NRDE family protein [Pseudomonadota bacterium]HLS99041.1 NRDE family protein [Porticoccaceae bacterium]
MCLIALAWQAHPRYPLVLVANRDEFLDRPAAPAHWWPQHPGLLAGRDLEAGGTWLAVGASGRFAAVTNYREGRPVPGDRSRGELPLHFVTGNDAPEAFVAGLAAQGLRYGGFNLLAGDGDSIAWCSNRKAGHQRLVPGIHTLSNHLLDTPWPKSELARLKLQKLLHGDDFGVEELFAVLADRAPFDDHSLPVTGVGLDKERVLSPPFIVADGYGTRCTTVLRVDRAGRLLFAEQNFDNGERHGPPRLFHFTVGGG